MIIIKAKRDGFRRCGVAHPAKPTKYQDDAFTAEQLAEMQAEPMLDVSAIGVDPGAGDQATTSKKTGGKKAKG